MQVAATTTMARMLAKACKDKGLDYQVRYITTNAEGYRYYIGDIWDAEYYGDFSVNTGKYRAIEICYDPNDYACPRYLTTQEIRNIRQHTNPKSAEELVERLVEAVEI